MASTTNYSWTTPDDTDLVKDGAAAIRSLGSAIDTTVFTNAGNAVQKSTIDAKGDLLVGTADNTITRLAVGTNNYVLTADSAEASGVKWAAPSAGSLKKISKQTFSSSSAVNINNVFSSTYRSYRIIFDATASNSDVNISMRLRVSGSDTNTNYVDYTFINSGGSTAPESITDQFRLVRACSTGRNFGTGDFINPYSAEPTGYFGFGAGSFGYTNWTAGRHTASTSYDGFSILVGAGTITGEVTIYGYEA